MSSILCILMWSTLTFIYTSANEKEMLQSLNRSKMWSFEHVYLSLSATVVERAGKSAGAFGDDQQPEQTANLLKTTLWLTGQGPVSVNRIFLIIWVLNHRPKSYPAVCLSVISITFIQGVLISQRLEESLAESQKRWSKRKPLSASLEGRSVWEQINVEDVAIGHCCDVWCVVEELRPDGW